MINVLDPLAGLFPEHGIPRGSIVALTGTGAVCSLLLAILAGPVANGAWAGIAGMPQLGLEAAAGFGVPIDRLLLTPYIGGEWPSVVAAMLDGCDLAAVSPPGTIRASLAQRIAARAREHRSVLLLTSTPSTQRALLGTGPGPGPGTGPDTGHSPRAWRHPTPMWPDAVDIHLQVEAGQWHGIDTGAGVLRSRLVTVRSSGRRSSMLERSIRLWLPAPSGQVMLARDGHVADNDTDHVAYHVSDAPGHRPQVPAAPLAG